MKTKFFIITLIVIVGAVIVTIWYFNQTDLSTKAPIESAENLLPKDADTHIQNTQNSDKSQINSTLENNEENAQENKSQVLDNQPQLSLPNGNNQPSDQVNTPSQNTSQKKGYPLHTNIVATVFWIGEPVGNGSSEDNAISAWDDEWQKNYGGYDDYENRNGYYPVGFIPKQNPFYLDLPYNDFNNNGSRKANSYQVVPWAGSQKWDSRTSMMKNRWVKLIRNGVVCYGQIEDSGPYQYDDFNYVFSTEDARPKNKSANNAGMDVSPALRDCLKFEGLNNADNKVDWQFVESSDVPNGPWKQIVTSSQINWP